MKTFKSKRNKVFLQDGRVVKSLADRDATVTEAGLLLKYFNAGLCVPRVFEVSGNEIIMEYISGETIPDFLAQMANKRNEDAMRLAAAGLVHWLKCFYDAAAHEQSGEIRGDVNGRNFIFDGECIASVDFEEKAFGTPEQDIGRLLAFILTYDIEPSVKKLFARLFICEAMKSLPLSMHEVGMHYKSEISAMRERRGGTVTALTL